VLHFWFESSYHHFWFESSYHQIMVSISYSGIFLKQKLGELWTWNNIYLVKQTLKDIWNTSTKLFTWGICHIHKKDLKMRKRFEIYNNYNSVFSFSKISFYYLSKPLCTTDTKRQNIQICSLTWGVAPYNIFFKEQNDELYVVKYFMYINI